MKPKAITLILALLFGAWSTVSAQSYDDDDIYFNPSKAAKPKKEVKKTTVRQPDAYIYYPAADYPAADTYAVTDGGRSISVDDYNRRGVFGNDSSRSVTDSILDASFANTRRIERFYNPSVVSGSDDQELAQVYYAQPANVNIIIEDPWMSPYSVYPGYAGSWGWGNPWRYGYWGWNSWNWGWGPSWSWSWGPSWGWGPAWSWGPSWGWGPGWGPSWGWAPSRPSYRPGAVGNVRPGTGYRPGRPSSGSYRPSSVGGNRPGSSGYRQGRGNTRGGQSDYTRPSNNTNSNSGGYRPGSSRSSGSSWGGGSTGGGFRGGSMGGGMRGGGGGGRGRH